jgi:hypothetical protein
MEDGTQKQEEAGVGHMTPILERVTSDGSHHHGRLEAVT